MPDDHIRLIDFDAARVPKENREQDTVQLGTRGYAPPEQYGFSQTDERADIYALGVTIKQLLGGRAEKLRYRKTLSKCTSLDPEKRYSSVRRVKNAFFDVPVLGTAVLCIAAAGMAALVLGNVFLNSEKPQEASLPVENGTDLITLPTPADPFWDGETGSGFWGCVLESGVGDDQRYDWRLYRQDTATPPDLEKVLSDVFEFTGKDAPRLPAPEGLHWIAREGDESRWYFAAFTNWDDYADKDAIDTYVYNGNGEYVMNSMVHKSFLIDSEWPGMRIRQEFVGEPGETYRFAIQAHTSRPNEYRSSPVVTPYPEEAYLSPPLRVPEPFE